MTSTLQKLALTTGLALSFSALNAPQAQALSLFNFTVTPDLGPLAGATYAGDFSFDDTGLTGVDSETVPLSSFNFNFLSKNYTQADDPNSLAEFFNGQFLGIEYQFDGGALTSFSFTPGTNNLADAVFTYDVIPGAANQQGFGDIAYTAVPTPALLPGLLGLGAAVVRRKRRGAVEQSA